MFCFVAPFLSLRLETCEPSSRVHRSCPSPAAAAPGSSPRWVRVHRLCVGALLLHLWGREESRFPNARSLRSSPVS